MTGSDIFTRWQGTDGQKWKEIMNHIEPTLERLAASWGAKVQYWRWDDPSALLLWYTDDNTGRTITVKIVGVSPAYSLSIDGSMWVDDRQKLERKGTDRSFQQNIPVPPDIKQVDIGRLTTALLEAYATISSLAEPDLTSRSKLSPLPYGLNGRSVRGV